MDDPERWFDAIVSRDYHTVQEGISLFAGTQNADGLTGLMLAVQNDDPKMVRLLVEQEAKLTNNDGDNALMLAAKLDVSSCIPILLPYLSDCRRDDSVTPLMVAAEAGSIHALRVLFFHYGNESDNMGLTALDYASRAGHHECVESLLHECPFDTSTRMVAAENAQANGHDSLALYIMNVTDKKDSDASAIEALAADKDAEIERLQALLQELEGRNSELVVNLSSARDEVVELKEQRDTLTGQEECLRREVQELTDKLSDATHQVAELLEKNGQQNSIDDLSAQLAEQSAIQEKLQAEVNDLRAENDQLLCTLKNTENTLVDTENRLANKTLEHGEKSAELDAKQIEIVALQEALRDAKDKCNALEQKLEETEQSLKKENMFKAIADIESAIGNNVTQNESNEAELSDLRQERDELQMQVETQETQLKLLKGKLDRLTAKNESLEQKYQSLNLEFRLQSEQLSETKDLLRITEKKLHSATSAQPRPGSTKDEGNHTESHHCATLENVRTETPDAEAAVHKSFSSHGGTDSMLVKSGLIDMNVPPARSVGIDLEKETDTVENRQQHINELKIVEDCLQRTIDEKKQILAALDSSLAHSKSQESALKKQKKQLDNVVNRLETLEKENEKMKKAAKVQPSAISRNVRSVSAAAKVVAAIARITEEETFNHDIVVKALVDTTTKLEEQIDELAEENEKLKHELTNAIGGELQMVEDKRGSAANASRNSVRSSSKSRSRSSASSSKHVSSSHKSSQKTSKVSASHHIEFYDTDNHVAPKLEERSKGALKMTFGLSGEQASALLEARLATYTPLMRAIMKGKASDIEANLEYAGQVAPDGKTALMLAAEYNRVSSVSLLLEKEAGIKDSSGQMAIHIALHRGHYEVAEKLRKAEGLEVEPIERVNGTRTQLMSAAENNDVYAVWSLIPTQGALQDAEGITALMLAAGAGHKQIVALLIGSEAKIQTAWGTTALMWACQFGHIDCVRMLIPKEIRLRDRRGRSALHYATEAARHANAEIKKSIEALLRQHIG
ncbi:Ankyrin repeat protein [Giardia duodenalis]|uniref:Ankyrin repeat protein n=1 Tax=Giardia intestinalis TaxID=5741 RepID=V6TDZ0_GIAIN|nr:Ankyrin repeat protein [Giardia intestinalis]